MGEIRSTVRRIAQVLTLGCAAVLSTCSPRPSVVEKVRALEHLRVAMVESPNTCYSAADGPTGFECELLQGLAKQIGVALDVHFVDSEEEALAAVAEGSADIAAGGLTVNSSPQSKVYFTQPFEYVKLQLVYRADEPRPETVDKAQGGLTVMAGSEAEAHLENLKDAHGDLSWKSSTEDSEEDLVDAVAEGDIPYTIAASNLVALESRYYPNLRVAMDVSEPQPVAWALAETTDETLFATTQLYLHGIEGTELARIQERYFAEVAQSTYQGVARFSADVANRLPRYDKSFHSAATRYGLDWRLLAAIGYQESHWDPQAVSYTGVRGLMMLTTSTAAALDVSNRNDPAQSIMGGARYFSQIVKQLPPEIPDSERTWMALAAYNQGLYHLMDARGLVAKRKGDPNRWLDVRDALPLLSRPQWFKQTHYGYARGREAVNFVANVRNYYEILNWLQSDQSRQGPDDDDATTDRRDKNDAGTKPGAMLSKS